MTSLSELSQNVLPKVAKNESQNMTTEIKKLIKYQNFERALFLCNSIEGKNSVKIQSQEVKVLQRMFQKNNDRRLLEEALNICEKYKGNEIFDTQSNKIKLLLSKHFGEAITLNDSLSVPQIKFLMEQGKLSESLNLCNVPNNSKSKIIQSQKVKVLLLMFKQDNNKELLEEALNICEKYKGNEIFDTQSNKIKLLLSKHFGEKKTLNDSSSVSQIKFLMDEKKLSEVLNLCNDPKNLENKIVQSQKVKILLLMFKQDNNKKLLEEALNICKKNSGNQVFDDQRSIIEKRIEKYFKLSTLLTQIYLNNISKEVIENSDIDLWDKQLLLIAYYEKNNKKAGLNYIKEIKQQYQDITEKKKILNVLSERLKSEKIKIFDSIIYSKYLNCTINPTSDLLTSEEEKNIAKEDTSNIKTTFTVIKNQRKQEIKSKKIISCSGTAINRYNQSGNHNSKKNSSKSTAIKNNQTYIKDIFPQEILDIGTRLYIEMNTANNQLNAIKAWDNFDYLINKSSDDKDALTRMISLLRRLEHSDILTTKPSETNFQKRLKK